MVMKHLSERMEGHDPVFDSFFESGGTRLEELLRQVDETRSSHNAGSKINVDRLLNDVRRQLAMLLPEVATLATMLAEIRDASQAEEFPLVGIQEVFNKYDESRE
jgi:hypothetical protein